MTIEGALILKIKMKEKCEHCKKTCLNGTLLKHISHARNCKVFYGDRYIQMLGEKYSNKLSMKALVEKDILMKKQGEEMRKAPHFFMYIYLFLFCRKWQ